MANYRSRLEPVKIPPPYDEFRLLEESWRAMRVVVEHQLHVRPTAALCGPTALLRCHHTVLMRHLPHTPAMLPPLLCPSPRPCPRPLYPRSSTLVSQVLNPCIPGPRLLYPRSSPLVSQVLDEHPELRGDVQGVIDLARRLELSLVRGLHASFAY